MFYICRNALDFMPPLSMSPGSSDRPSCISLYVLKEVDAFLQKMATSVSDCRVFIIAFVHYSIVCFPVAWQHFSYMHATVSIWILKWDTIFGTTWLDFDADHRQWFLANNVFLQHACTIAHLWVIFFWGGIALLFSRILECTHTVYHREVLLSDKRAQGTKYQDMWNTRDPLGKLWEGVAVAL